MKLNHLNLTVTDVPETVKFLETYFGLQSRGGNKNMAFLTDDDGLMLSLTSMKVGGQSEVKYPANFHVGFIQENEEQVNAINQRLRDDGYNVELPSRSHA